MKLLLLVALLAGARAQAAISITDREIFFEHGAGSSSVSVDEAGVMHVVTPGGVTSSVHGASAENHELVVEGSFSGVEGTPNGAGVSQFSSLGAAFAFVREYKGPAAPAFELSLSHEQHTIAASLEVPSASLILANGSLWSGSSVTLEISEGSHVVLRDVSLSAAT